MILVAADVWLKSVGGQAPAISTKVSELLRLGLVLGHQFVLGELMLDGRTPACKSVIDRYNDLEQADVLPLDEVWAFAKAHNLAGKGLSWDDAALLAAVHHTKAKLWTTSDILGAAASELHIAYEEGNS